MTIVFTLPSVAAPDVDRRGRRRTEEERPEAFPKDLRGFPDVALPPRTGTWAEWSGCVAGGMELPPPVTDWDLWMAVADAEGRLQDVVQDIVRRDVRKRVWEAWLDEPGNFIDSRYGEAFARLARHDQAIRSGWEQVAAAIGQLVGAGSQIDAAGREEIALYTETSRQRWVEVADAVRPVEGFLRQPRAEVGDGWLSTARLMAIAHGASSGLATSPRAELGLIVDRVAQRTALRILRVNHWNRQRALLAREAS